MLTHPFIRPSGPALGGGGSMRPSPMGVQARPGAMPMHQSNPMGSQRTEVALGLARQRMLANALRGGTNTGAIQPTPNPGIVKPQGLPQVR